MKTHNIALESFIPHGKILANVNNGELQITGINNYGAYIGFPDKFKLPFRIDMTAKMDSPAFIMRIGDGYIKFNTGGMDNRRMVSIIGGETKPGIHKFDNRVPLGEYFDISLIYGRKAMQLIINGEERYFNTKDIYMKSKTIDTDFADGFSLKLACHQRTEIFVKSLTVMEYDSEPEFAELPKPDYIYAPSLTRTDKPTLDDCIADLTPELKEKIHEMDIYLKSLKFKRKIEGGYPESKITYFIPKVVSYQIKTSHHLLWHRTTAMLGFYINNSGERTDEFNVEFLKKIKPELAGEIFNRMYEIHCGSCRGNHSCAHYNITEYNGCKKNNCQHIIMFKMIPTDFDDVKKVIEVIMDMAKT